MNGLREMMPHHGKAADKVNRFLGPHRHIRARALI